MLQHLKLLWEPHSRRNNSKSLSGPKKDIGHVEFCLSNLFLHPKTHNLISIILFPQIPGTITLLRLLDHLLLCWKTPRNPLERSSFSPLAPFIAGIIVFNATSNHLFTFVSLVCEFLEARLSVSLNQNWCSVKTFSVNVISLTSLTV